jgi:hypothetical protein
MPEDALAWQESKRFATILALGVLDRGLCASAPIPWQKPAAPGEKRLRHWISEGNSEE